VSAGGCGRPAPAISAYPLEAGARALDPRAVGAMESSVAAAAIPRLIDGALSANQEGCPGANRGWVLARRRMPATPPVPMPPHCSRRWR
jgi:hypothetical protein